MSLGMIFARRRMMAVPGGIAADPILNNNPWDVISAVATAGEGANWWSVGDRKAIVLNGTVGRLMLSSYTIYAFILGFNHNEELEGYGRIHFQIGKTALSGGTDIALCDSSFASDVSSTGYFSMNSSKTNVGGWESSQMRNKICGTNLANYSGTIIGVIPAELREVLKSVTKYTNNTGNGSTSAGAVTATTDYFTLASEYEVFATTKRSDPNEAAKQKRYEYYAIGNSRRKYRHDSTGSGVHWWLRSPAGGNATHFIAATPSNAEDDVNANTSRGFAPIFCV